MEWVEVADSAVKIGLGALISGAVTYFVTRQSHARELLKIAYVRRLDSLEQISDSAEEHFEAWRKLASKMGGIYSGRNPPNPNFSDRQWKEILTRDKDLLSTRESLSHAAARLRLLSATGAAVPLSDFTRAVGEFRDKLILMRETPRQEDFDRTRKETRRAVREFHEAISLTYLSTKAPSGRKPSSRSPAFMWW